MLSSRMFDDQISFQKLNSGLFLHAQCSAIGSVSLKKIKNASLLGWDFSGIIDCV